MNSSDLAAGRRPWCHNRPDRAAGYWQLQLPQPGQKPRWRWRDTSWTGNACLAWAGVVSGNLRAPELAGWDCNGCRHDPR